MSVDQLPAHLWITAKVRQLNQEATPAFIIQKGEKNSGTLLVKVTKLDGTCCLYTQMRDLDGDLGWIHALKTNTPTEKEADAYIERVKTRDPDIWVVEIEDRSGTNPFEGKLIS